MDSHLRGNDKRIGFSLVELSIVLVVIGLLVSGILVGKDMIRAAELRSVTSEKDKIQTAVLLFQDKYQGLPGDLPNATDFWGTMPTGTCPNASDATGTQTCNGNGDGIVEMNAGLIAIGYNPEFYLIWQHLSNAGLIEGKYAAIWTGDWSSPNTDFESKISNVKWWGGKNTNPIFPQDISDTTYFEGEYGHILSIYVGDGLDNIFLPSEAWAIDKKIDDGLPGIGNVVTLERNGIDCNNVAPDSSTAIAQTATYNLATTEKVCRLNFKNVW